MIERQREFYSLAVQGKEVLKKSILMWPVSIRKLRETAAKYMPRVQNLWVGTNADSSHEHW